MNIYYNQRFSERSRYEIPIMYSRKDGNNCHSAMMLDCSDNGICIMSDYPYLPDSLLNLKMVHDKEMHSVRVVWNHAVQDDASDAPYYRIGAEFTESD